MEAYTKLVVVALVLGLAILTSPTGTNGDGFCGMTPEGLKACQPFVVAPENPDPPSKACCSALSYADLKCLCKYKDSKLLDLYKINFEQAKKLPAKCKLPGSFDC